MSGIWDVCVRGGENTIRVNITLLRCELMAVALGVRTRAAAKANIEAELGRSLDTAETTDLNAIADNYETGTSTDRLVYNAKVEMIMNAAELALVDETEFRSVLGIS